MMINMFKNQYNGLSRTQHGAKKYKAWINLFCLALGATALLFGAFYIGAIAGNWNKLFSISFAAIVSACGVGSAAGSSLLKYKLLKPLFRALAQYKKEVEKEEKNEKEIIKKIAVLELNVEKRKLLLTHKNYLFLVDSLANEKNNDEKKYTKQLDEIDDGELKFIAKIDTPKFKQVLAALRESSVDLDDLKKYCKEKIIEKINKTEIESLTSEFLNALKQEGNGSNEIKIVINEKNIVINDKKNESKKREEKNEKVGEFGASSFTIFGAASQNNVSNENKIINLDNNKLP